MTLLVQLVHYYTDVFHKKLMIPPLYSHYISMANGMSPLNHHYINAITVYSRP